MLPTLIPYGIYTIPEISMVGYTEEQLTHQKVPYETGVARYVELAKGQMLGDDQGFLKLLFDPESLKLLGVHVIGERAAEIVHIGQAVLTMDGSIEYFRDTIFNYPTLAEALQSRRSGWYQQALKGFASLDLDRTPLITPVALASHLCLP
jgi:NAD(P) transhydrogenase